MFSATSSAFLSPYSPFANGGDNKGSISTGKDKGIVEARAETSALNYINDSLEAPLSYPHRLVKGYKPSICNRTKDDI